MDLAAGLKDRLRPLEASLAANARSDAETRMEDARAQADRIREDAEEEAAEILARARNEGAAAASRQSAHRLVEAKRRARGRVLHAQREAYDALVDAAMDALRGLGDQPEYAALQDHLAQVATATLGPAASVQRNPAGRCGVLAQLDGRRVDLTLPVLVRRCVARLGKEVSRLWE